MHGTNRGFCLLEALLSVLVLSIGLLGVARLQVSLWAAASDLHTARQAHRFACSELDKTLYRAARDTGRTPPSVTELTTPGARLRATATSRIAAQTLTASTEVTWQDRAGVQSLSLGTDMPAIQHPADARWLLLQTVHPAHTTASP